MIVRPLHRSTNCISSARAPSLASPSIRWIRHERPRGCRRGWLDTLTLGKFCRAAREASVLLAIQSRNIHPIAQIGILRIKEETPATTIQPQAMDKSLQGYLQDTSLSETKHSYNPEESLRLSKARSDFNRGDYGLLSKRR